MQDDGLLVVGAVRANDATYELKHDRAVDRGFFGEVLRGLAPDAWQLARFEICVDALCRYVEVKIIEYIIYSI